jgi:hypothetical protein
MTLTKTNLFIGGALAILLAYQAGKLLVLPADPAISSAVAQSNQAVRALEDAQRQRRLDDSNRIAACERQLKQRLNDPKSYERLGAWISDNGVINIVYRANNAFGAPVQDYAECGSAR